MLAIMVTVAVIITSITLMRRNLRLMETMRFAQGHRDGNKQSPNSDSVLSDSKAYQAFNCFGMYQ